MKSFIKKLFSPKKLSLKSCPGCLDAALPLFPQGAAFASLPTTLARQGRYLDMTSFADPTDYPGHITQYATDVFVWYDEAGMMSGVEYSLEAAQQAAKQYVARLESPSQFVDAPLTLKVSALSELASGRHYSENESFVEEYLSQHGMEYLDDECLVLGMTLATVIKLLEDYQAPMFFTAGVESAAILKWRTDYNAMAGKLAKAQSQVAELERDIEGKAAHDVAQGKVIHALNDKVSALGGVNKRLRSKLRMARNARNQLRAKLADVGRAFNTACDDTAMWSGQLVGVARRFNEGTLSETDINQALNGELQIFPSK